jgi:asparagine synthase (glutamine-hydrolysing)
MCGIAGLYGIPADADVLPRMLDAIAHRGPDAEGVHEIVSHGADVRLGHRRLSIIDLSEAANQPFEKDGLIIVYNGELYNYKELGEELRASGVRFRTTSDTEVVLEAWRKWGADCLNRFRGMFAFAMLDTRTGRLVLARDPFGIKPLFIARRNGGLAFASELKGITPALGNDLKVNSTALISSLMYYWIPEGHCVYEGVQKLPPGYWAEIGGPAAHDHRRVGRGPYGCRRSRLGFSLRRPGLQPAHGDRGPTGPQCRRLYDLLPRRGSEARGDARRPVLRAQDRQGSRPETA